MFLDYLLNYLLLTGLIAVAIMTQRQSSSVEQTEYIPVRVNEREAQR